MQSSTNQYSYPGPVTVTLISDDAYNVAAVGPPVSNVKRIWKNFVEVVAVMVQYFHATGVVRYRLFVADQSLQICSRRVLRKVPSCGPDRVLLVDEGDEVV